MVSPKIKIGRNDMSFFNLTEYGGFIFDEIDIVLKCSCIFYPEFYVNYLNNLGY